MRVHSKVCGQSQARSQAKILFQHREHTQTNESHQEHAKEIPDTIRDLSK
jgi:hypothetical protein